jgi:hypothetical protein
MGDSTAVNDGKGYFPFSIVGYHCSDKQTIVHIITEPGSKSSRYQTPQGRRNIQFIQSNVHKNLRHTPCKAYFG